MTTKKFNKGNTLIIAHRGLSGIEVENTASAFVAAANRSYYGIEMDIHLSADGNFIINHDDNFERVAGVKRKICDMTLDEIKQVVLFDKDGTKNRHDLHPTTLECYLGIVTKYEKHAVIELKSDFSDSDILRIIDTVRGFSYLDSTTFISFNYENLVKVRKILPNQSAQYLIWHLTDEEIERLSKAKMDADVWCVELTREQIEKAHAHGIKVNCWTVNEIPEGEKFASWGIDFITTNILE